MTNNTRSCASCGINFEVTRPTKRCCSPTCKRRIKERRRRERRKSTPCSVSGCNNPGVRSSRLCDMHYMRRQRGQIMEAPHRLDLSPVCTVAGCGRPTYWLELCKRHYLEHHARAGKAWAIIEYESAGAREKTARYGGKYGVVNRFEVFERDGWVCQLCGEPVDPDLKGPDPRCASLDHIVPLSWGGDHSMENCQLAHLSCNSSKQDLRVV